MSDYRQRKLQNQRLAEIAKHSQLEREIVALRDAIEEAQEQELVLQGQLRQTQGQRDGVMDNTIQLEDNFEDYRLDAVLGVGTYRRQ